MLTGRRVFEARDVSEVLASVLLKDPDLTSLPTNVPPGVRSLLARCLVKESKDRLRDIGEARLALRDVGTTSASSVPADSPPTSATPTAGRRQLQVWQRPVAIVGTVLVAVLVTGLAVWSLTRPDAVPVEVMRFVIPPSEAAPFDFSGPCPDVAIFRRRHAGRLPNA